MISYLDCMIPRGIDRGILQSKWKAGILQPAGWPWFLNTFFSLRPDHLPHCSSTSSLLHSLKVWDVFPLSSVAPMSRNPDLSWFFCWGFWCVFEGLSANLNPLLRVFSGWSGSLSILLNGFRFRVIWFWLKWLLCCCSLSCWGFSGFVRSGHW